MYPNPFATMQVFLPTKRVVTPSNPVVPEQVPVDSEQTSIQQQGGGDPLVTFARVQERLNGRDRLRERVAALGLTLDMSFLNEADGHWTPSSGTSSEWSVWCEHGYESSFSIGSTESQESQEMVDATKDEDKTKDKKVVRFDIEEVAKDAEEAVADGEEVKDVENTEGIQDDASDTDSNTDSAVSSECDWVPYSTITRHIPRLKPNYKVEKIVYTPAIFEAVEEKKWVYEGGQGWVKEVTPKAYVGKVDDVNIHAGTPFDGEETSLESLQREYKKFPYWWWWWWFEKDSYTRARP